MLLHLPGRKEGVCYRIEVVLRQFILSVIHPLETTFECHHSTEEESKREKNKVTMKFTAVIFALLPPLAQTQSHGLPLPVDEVRLFVIAASLFLCFSQPLFSPEQFSHLLLPAFLHHVGVRR